MMIKLGRRARMKSNEVMTIESMLDVVHNRARRSLPNVFMSQYACNTMPRFIVESQNLPLVACGSLALISLQDSAAKSLIDPSGTVVSIKTNCCYPFVLDLVCIAGLWTVIAHSSLGCIFFVI